MTDDSRLVLNNCHIIDANNPSPKPASVVVEGGQIVDVLSSPPPQATAEATVIDLKGGFLLPGLWDVHTHIGRGIPDHEARDESTDERTVRAGRNCTDILNLGFTGLRVVGERDFVDVAWKGSDDPGQYRGRALVTWGEWNAILVPAGLTWGQKCFTASFGRLGWPVPSAFMT